MPRDKMNLFMNGVLLLLAALLLPKSEAALARGIFKDPAHPGKCVVKPNLILSPGESARYPDMDCARIMCGQNSHATISTCGAQGAPPGYAMGEPKYPNADYPKCCERDVIINNDIKAIKIQK